MLRESSTCCRCVAYFDGIVDPATVKTGKPAPDIFLAGAQLAGAEPVDCVGVEDAASGIEAIKAAGIVAVGVGDEQVLSLADRVLPSTADLSLAVLQEAWAESHGN